MRFVGIVMAGVVAGWGGAGAFAHGDLHERIDELTARLDASPKNPDLLLRRADLLRQHDDFDGALRDLDTLTAMNSRQDDALLLRGRTLLECACGRAEEAATALAAFLDRRPSHGEAWLLLARARRATGNAAGSVAAYGRAIALMDAPGPGVFLERADIVLGTPGGGDRALAGIDEGIDRLGPIATLELRAAELEIARGRVEAALDRIDIVMGQAARKESWLARKGEILEAVGRADEALAMYRAAREALRAAPSRARGAGGAPSLSEEIDCAIERLKAAGEQTERAGATPATTTGAAGGAEPCDETTKLEVPDAGD